MVKERGMRHMGAALIGFAAMAIEAMRKANRFTDQIGGDPSVAQARRIYGPRVTASKNIGRDWLKQSRGYYKPHQGKQECARRAKLGPSWSDPTGAPPFLGTATQPGPMFNRAVERRQWRAILKAARRAHQPDPRIALRAERRAAKKAA